jgi:hypothetical protein
MDMCRCRRGGGDAPPSPWLRVSLDRYQPRAMERPLCAVPTRPAARDSFASPVACPHTGDSDVTTRVCGGRCSLAHKMLSTPRQEGGRLRVEVSMSRGDVPLSRATQIEGRPVPVRSHAGTS